MDTRTEDDLGRAGREGDQAAFQTLVERLTRSLIAAAYRYTGDWEAARDLSQETWLRVWRHLPSYDGGRPFRPWVLAIHRNVCLTHLRGLSRRREDITPSDELERLAPPAESPDPLAALSDAEFAARVRRALPALSPAQREVFVRVDLERGAQAEVARDLGLQPTTLRTTLHFARRRLARLLVAGQEDR